MPGELQYPAGTTGLDVYGRVLNDAGQVWNGSAFVTNSATNYAASTKVTVDDNGSGDYVGDAPSGALTAGATRFQIRLRNTPSVEDEDDAVVWADLMGTLATTTNIVQSLAQTRPAIVNSPITATEMYLMQGNKYSEEEETQIELVKQNGERWPLTINTIHFYCAPTSILLAENSEATGISGVELSSVTDSGGILELDEEQTGALAVTNKSGRYNFWFRANQGTAPFDIRTGALTVTLGTPQ